METPGAVVDAGLDADGAVEMKCFFEQRLRLRRMAELGLEDGNAEQGVGEFEGACAGVAAVERERLPEVGFGVEEVSAIKVDCAEVASGVGDPERVADFELQGEGFGVLRESGGGVAEIALYLTEAGECAREDGGVGLGASEGHGGAHMLDGAFGIPGSACLEAEPNELVGVRGHDAGSVVERSRLRKGGFGSCR